MRGTHARRRERNTTGRKACEARMQEEGKEIQLAEKHVRCVCKKGKKEN